MKHSSIFSLVVSSLRNVGPAMGDFGPTSTWARIPSSGLLLTVSYVGREVRITHCGNYIPSKNMEA